MLLSLGKKKMKWKALISISINTLSLLGMGLFTNTQTVSAVKNNIFLPGNIHIYDHKGRVTKKVFRKKQELTYTSIKSIKKQKYYRIGKNKYIKSNSVFRINRAEHKKPNQNANKYDTTKNAASLMDFISSDTSLTSAQREEAQKAANLLRTGEIVDHTPTGDKSWGKPSWFDECVSLGDKSDSTNALNIKATLISLERVNKERAAVGINELKVSPTSTAISMIDADYQKKFEFDHPLHYGYRFNRENLSLGSGEPVGMWMTEKNDWLWNVNKNPSLAPFEFSPNWRDKDYDDAILGLNGYKTAGHYTNLVDKTYRVMGLARIIDIEFNYGSYNATSQGEDGAISVAQYKNLVNEWLEK